MSRFTIGLAQIEPRLGDVAANVKKHLEFISQAKEKGVDLLVFPEMSLTGYFVKDLASELALGLDDPPIEELLAASETLDIIVGFIELNQRYLPYISAAYLSQGKLVHLHRKVYPPTYGLFSDLRYFGAGEQVRAFETRFGKMAILICEDAWHIALPYIAWMDGADFLVFISSSPGRGVGTTDTRLGSARSWELINRMYAHTFTTFIIHCNRVGYEEGINFWGGSSIMSPDGQLRVQAPFFEEVLVTQRVDTTDFRRERTALPLLREENLDLTLRELERVRKERYQL